MDRPLVGKDIVMTFPLRLIARPALAVSSITLLVCSLGGTAMSQPTPAGANIELPGVTVEAPKHIARPHRPLRSAVGRSTKSAAISPTQATVAPHSEAAKLAKLAATTNNCVGGCQSSFKSGDKPWVGCNVSGGVYSATCRNVGNYKSYDECKEAGRLTGWRSGETSAYCSSVAIVAGWR
ncbi:hypothetical protein LPJ38_08690 [Bradyrhizobium daqingense]|uniref:Uncharacterized protein n=1 Tax=Bradyrhizobium daqingense TaxID=993502 RepID=A0A562KU33_9BRAD|nr:MULTISPECIES: hypothetical protein [Bradyrhizobium]MDQ8731170.1 hypothetical protein [Bradyrhizobium sp. LHD-71]TWH98939.1 hypothetical protein IQ17_05516 [Bradyrhizobium daqingense]UFS90792.1 hypothetical protein LPJ38_08690 [Bradyrhizobium daqingense]